MDIDNLNYNIILHPKTARRYKISKKLGQSLIQNYRKSLYLIKMRVPFNQRPKKFQNDTFDSIRLLDGTNEFNFIDVDTIDGEIVLLRLFKKIKPNATKNELPLKVKLKVVKKKRKPKPKPKPKYLKKQCVSCIRCAENYKQIQKKELVKHMKTMLGFNDLNIKNIKEYSKCELIEMICTNPKIDISKHYSYVERSRGKSRKKSTKKAKKKSTKKALRENEDRIDKLESQLDVYTKKKKKDRNDANVVVLMKKLLSLWTIRSEIVKHPDDIKEANEKIDIAKDTIEVLRQRINRNKPRKKKPKKTHNYKKQNKAWNKFRTYGRLYQNWKKRWPNEPEKEFWDDFVKLDEKFQKWYKLDDKEEV